MAYGDLKALTILTELISSSEETIYTTPTGKKTEVCSIWLYNGHSASVEVSIWLPVSAGSGADGNKRIDVTLASKESLEISPKVPFCLSANTFIRAVAGTDAKVSVMATGREES